MISVLILTWREEADLPRCLSSLSWCDDIHVFDSFSDDRTLEIARTAGARVTQRAFDDYARQRNAALMTVPFRHSWVLSVDADEVVPSALVAEMEAFVVQASAEVVAARIRRRDYLWGRWLKHAQISPFYIRLFRPDRVRYEREINEVLVPFGSVAELREPFDHHPFSKGISAWVDRHNRYSTMEASRAVTERAMGERFSLKRAMFDSDFNIRRRHQKGLFYRLPGRPVVKLVYMIFWRGAMFDGYPGLIYSFLQGFYEFLIVAKEKELMLLQVSAGSRDA